MLVLHEVPQEVTENLKEFCIRSLYVLLCCFSFPKRSSNFLPALRDETSLKEISEKCTSLFQKHMLSVIFPQEDKIQTKSVHIKDPHSFHKRNFAVITLIYPQTLLMRLKAGKL